MFLPLYFRLFYIAVAPVFFLIWGIREGRRAPDDRNVKLALQLLAGASVLTAIISYGTTRTIFRDDIIYVILICPLLYAGLFFGTQRLFDAHRETMDEWLETEETENTKRIRVRQSIGRRAKRFFILLALTILSMFAFALGLDGGQDGVALIGALGLLVFGFATLIGLFPYLATLTARSIVTIDASETALHLTDPDETISFASVTEIAVRSANDESFAVQPQRTDRGLFVGGTGAAGASFAAASVVGATSKAVGEVAGQSAVLGLHIVRSGSDCSVEIAHGGGRRTVAAYLNKKEAHFLAQQIANICQTG
ncbi:MAG: hypothetical protein HEP70_20325 [Rhodobiaceae bacterium]|nr:hypothetical protein [Rhodobiaceae bacterium]